MATTHQVKIANMSFDPTPLTIGVGDSVTWTNVDQFAHTATADDGSFDSSDIDPNAEYTHTFGSAGDIKYHCDIHLHMTGRIVVK